jgi:4-hydroxy-3-methylbut-2-enyl diphosphate reductase
MMDHYGLTAANAQSRFADTRDTLCYATNDNQSAVSGMLEADADFALVIGGYNSSNTSHLAELCEHKLPTYFISDESCLTANAVTHYNQHTSAIETTQGYLPPFRPLRVLVTSGASCPDALVERVMRRLADITGYSAALADLTGKWTQGVSATL